MEIKGKVHKVGQTEQVSDKFSKRELVIKTEDNPQYPQYISMQCVNDKTVMLDNLPLNSEVSCQLNIRGREWTSPSGEVKYFNTLELWKLEVTKKSEDLNDLI